MVGSTNAYKKTESDDYLDEIRRHVQENDNANTSAENFTPTFIKPVTNTVNVANSFTNTQKTLGDYDVVDNTSKLVAYIPFDLDVNDAMNTNHGTVTGTEQYADGPELRYSSSGGHAHRKAFDFDGSTEIALDNESNFDRDRTQSFSWSFWFKTSVTSVLDVIIGKMETGSGVGQQIFLKDSDNQLRIRHGGTSQAVIVDTTGLTVRDNAWHHVVWTHSGSGTAAGMKIYVDSVLASTTTAQDDLTSQSTLNNNPLLLGNQDPGDTFYFTGQMSQVQIWNVELDSDDVTDLYSGKQINKDTAATNPAILGLSDIA